MIRERLFGEKETKNESEQKQSKFDVVNETEIHITEPIDELERVSESDEGIWTKLRLPSDPKMIALAKEKTREDGYTAEIRDPKNLIAKFQDRLATYIESEYQNIDTVHDPEAEVMHLGKDDIKTGSTYEYVLTEFEEGVFIGGASRLIEAIGNNLKANDSEIAFLKNVYNLCIEDSELGDILGHTVVDTVVFTFWGYVHVEEFTEGYQSSSDAETTAELMEEAGELAREQEEGEEDGENSEQSENTKNQSEQVETADKNNKDKNGLIATISSVFNRSNDSQFNRNADDSNTVTESDNSKNTIEKIDENNERTSKIEKDSPSPEDVIDIENKIKHTDASEESESEQSTDIDEEKSKSSSQKENVGESENSVNPEEFDSLLDTSFSDENPSETKTQSESGE